MGREKTPLSKLQRGDTKSLHEGRGRRELEGGKKIKFLCKGNP